MASVPAARISERRSSVKAAAIHHVSSPPPANSQLSNSSSSNKSHHRSAPVFPLPSYELLHTNPEVFYQKLNPLGTGAFGTVYEAKHLESGQIRALKTVKETEKHGADDLMREVSFLRHAASDWVCKFYEAYLYEGKVTFALEHFQCGSVHDLMKMAGVHFKEDFLLHVITQTLLALEFLQSVLVIHRDIKCGNLLLNSAGQTKLCDFGVSRLFQVHNPSFDPKISTTGSFNSKPQLSGGVYHTKTIIGTPYWMAPEIVIQSGYTFNADIWSLGITLIEMNDGNPPCSRIDPVRALYIIQRRPPPKLTKVSGLSREIRDFATLCLTKMKVNRPFASDLLQSQLIKPIAKVLRESNPLGASPVVREVIDKNLHKVVEFRSKTKFIDDDDIVTEESHNSLVRIGGKKPNLNKNRKKPILIPEVSDSDCSGSGDGGSIVEYPGNGGSFDSLIAMPFDNLDDLPQDSSSQDTLVLETGVKSTTTAPKPEVSNDIFDDDAKSHNTNLTDQHAVVPVEFEVKPQPKPSKLRRILDPKQSTVKKLKNSKSLKSMKTPKYSRKTRIKTNVDDDLPFTNANKELDQLRRQITQLRKQFFTDAKTSVKEYQAKVNVIKRNTPTNDT